MPASTGLNYKVSVADMVNSSKKNGGENDFGVPGMDPKRLIIPNLEKPNSFSIPKEHAVKKDYMSALAR